MFIVLLTAVTCYHVFVLYTHYFFVSWSMLGCRLVRGVGLWHSTIWGIMHGVWYLVDNRLSSLWSTVADLCCRVSSQQRVICAGLRCVQSHEGDRGCLVPGVVFCLAHCDNGVSWMLICSYFELVSPERQCSHVLAIAHTNRGQSLCLA